MTRPEPGEVIRILPGHPRKTRGGLFLVDAVSAGSVLVGKVRVTGSWVTRIPKTRPPVRGKLVTSLWVTENQWETHE